MDIITEIINAGLKIRKKNANGTTNTWRKLFVNICLFNYICCQIMTVLGNTTSIPQLHTNISTINPNITRSPFPEALRALLEAKSKNELENSEGEINPPTNLHAVAFVPSGWDDLQLNITWTPPKEGSRHDLYYIEVVPENTTACNNNRKLYYEDVPSSAGSFLVPKELSSMDHSLIKPNCSYNITMRSLHSRKVFMIEITLPECVENICSCENISRLPEPIVQIKVFKNFFNVSWSLPNSSAIPSDIKISHYKIMLWKLSNSMLFRIEDTELVQVGKNTWIYFNATEIVEKGAYYKGTVEVIDVKNCEGPPGKSENISISDTTESKPADNITIKLLIILPLTVIFVWTLIKFTMSRIKSSQCCLKLLLASARGEQTLRRQPVWPAGSKFIVEGRQNPEAGDHRHLEERSPLYVEKEIEEARNRGEADSWEMSPSSIHYGSLIGEGAFGRVFIARAMSLPDSPIVAVKKLKDNASMEEVSEFLGEIEMLKFSGKHPHVVNIIGCCTLRQPYCVVLEYAERGDLLAHLRKLRDVYARRWNSSGFSITSSLVQRSNSNAMPSVAETEYTILESEASGPTKSTGCSNPTILGNIIQIGSDNGSILDPNFLSDVTGASLESDAFANSSVLVTGIPMQNTERVLNAAELHKFALQIARGMEHLEKKGITHRDLAARNVLIDGEGKLKISDLGLSRTGVYVTNNRRKVPLRWLAIEAIRSSHYSNKSDVWSYAVLLWEIGTLGGFPYPTLGDHQILPYLVEGRRLDKPIIVSQELYATMVRCWTENPEQRPSFGELVSLLEADESRNKAYIDISTLQTNISFPPTEGNGFFEGSC